MHAKETTEEGGAAQLPESSPAAEAACTSRNSLPSQCSKCEKQTATAGCEVYTSCTVTKQAPSSLHCSQARLCIVANGARASLRTENRGFRIVSFAKIGRTFGRVFQTPAETSWRFRVRFPGSTSCAKRPFSGGEHATVYSSWFSPEMTPQTAFEVQLSSLPWHRAIPTRIVAPHSPATASAWLQLVGHAEQSLLSHTVRRPQDPGRFFTTNFPTATSRSQVRLVGSLVS